MTAKGPVRPDSLILVLGGIRSGKSAEAVRLARERAGDAVAFVATARRGEDADFDRRIDRHRGDRSPGWLTIESGNDLGAAIRNADAGRLLLVDSLALWAADVVEAQNSIDDAWPGLKRAVASRKSGVILVSDEVGLGPVPLTEMGRRFADAVGDANARAAAVADEVRLVIAGLSVRLKP